VYDWYWRVFDRTILDDRAAEVLFYQGLLKDLPPHGLVFDIGANHGWKTDIFLRMGARVVAVEPDEVNQGILRQSFLSYRLSKKPVAIVGKALGEMDAVETMWIDAPGSAKNTLSKKWVDTLRTDESRFGQALSFTRQKAVTTTTLDKLIAEHGVPFFVKIDVEGHEPNVLRGLRQPVPYLSFEVNLPEFEPEGLECIELLGRLAADGRFNYVADCRKGFKLARWVGAAAFSQVLSDCADRSIEVFWTTKRAGEP
jgi:FkbM family methyltransferase